MRMTNKEAIEIIEAYKDRLTSSCSNLLDEDICAFDLAIKALKQIDLIKFNIHALNKLIEEIENENQG